MQWHLRDQRSWCSGRCSCSLRTKIPPKSFNCLMILSTVEEEIGKQLLPIFHWGTIYLFLNILIISIGFVSNRSSSAHFSPQRQPFVGSAFVPNHDYNHLLENLCFSTSSLALWMEWMLWHKEAGEPYVHPTPGPAALLGFIWLINQSAGTGIKGLPLLGSIKDVLVTRLERHRFDRMLFVCFGCWWRVFQIKVPFEFYPLCASWLPGHGGHAPSPGALSKCIFKK